jgi:hypothetical protein
LVPAVMVLALRLVDTLLITYNLKPNPYLKDVLPTKSSAQVMDLDGNYPGPGKEKIAILLLGSKCNHPLGIFAPDFSTMGDYLTKMSDELEGAENQDSGCKFPPALF